MQSLNMDRIRAFAVANRPQIDLAWHIFIFSPFLLQRFTKYLGPDGPKRARYINLPYLPLAAHLLLGAFIVWRYQYRAVTLGEAPKPEPLDFASGFANALASWILCRHNTRGNPKIQRTAFQAIAVQLGLAAVMAYRHESVEWYHAMVKTHNGFIYVRWVTNIGGPLGIFQNYGEAYTLAVFLGGLLGIMEARFPWEGILGVPVTLALMVALVAVERWVTARVTPR
jgi:hypothetical protein